MIKSILFFRKFIYYCEIISIGHCWTYVRTGTNFSTQMTVKSENVYILNICCRLKSDVVIRHCILMQSTNWTLVYIYRRADASMYLKFKPKNSIFDMCCNDHRALFVPFTRLLVFFRRVFRFFPIRISSRHTVLCQSIKLRGQTNCFGWLLLSLLLWFRHR